MQLEDAADESPQSFFGHRPETAACAPGHDREAPHDPRCVHGDEPFGRRIPAQDLLSRQQPQLAGLVLRESPDRGPGQTVRRGVGHETIGRVTRDVPALRAEPQVAASIRVERREPVGLDARRGRLVEGGEAHAIESGEPVERRDPEIAVVGLVKTGDDVLRQPVFGRPGFELILGQSRRGLAEDRQQRNRHQEHGRFERQRTRESRPTAGVWDCNSASRPAAQSPAPGSPRLLDVCSGLARDTGPAPHLESASATGTMAG